MSENGGSFSQLTRKVILVRIEDKDMENFLKIAAIVLGVVAIVLMGAAIISIL